MSDSLLSAEFQTVLKLQGLSTESYIGVFGCSDFLDMIRTAAADAILIEFSESSEVVMSARSTRHFVIITDSAHAPKLVDAIGSDLSSTVSIVVVGPMQADAVSGATLRACGVMSVLTEPKSETLTDVLRRGLEFRALKSLELSHRCESQRLARRELDLMGQPPENMTDDLNSVQPPPLPVGPISPYRLEESSEAFERAYIERVQHLCASSREAAIHLDVSAATLARRQRKEEAGQ